MRWQRLRWSKLEHHVLNRMHPDFLRVLKRLREIPVGRDFTVHDLGYHAGRGHVNVVPVIRAAKEAQIIAWTGRRKVGPTSYGPKGPIGRPRFLVYRRLC